MKEEAAPFWKLGASKQNVVVRITGIGTKNAEASLRSFLAGTAPGVVLTCGLAGGLNPDLVFGTVVFATGDATLSRKIADSGARPAKFFCATRIATTAAEKSELFLRTGADAVEMESEVIQRICQERGIPCATIRVISDTANEDLPLDFNQLSKRNLSLHYGKLALAVAKSPGKIRALLRLQKQTRFAAERLVEVLAKVV